MEIFVDKGLAYAETTRLIDILGSRVLTKNGEELGTVREVRVNAKKGHVEGILVRKRFFGRKLYIEKGYISRITNEAIMLTINPAAMYLGRSAVSSDGKKIGKVISVQRVKHTNDITSFIVRKSPIKTLNIDAKEFSKLGTSLILKKTYSEAKEAYAA